MLPKNNKEWREWFLEEKGIKSIVHIADENIWYAEFASMQSMMDVAKVINDWGYSMNITINKGRLKLMAQMVCNEGS